MAVTGAIFKSLTFDGEDSRDYGVYITGEAVYNAPERDVEMVSIPGRNGSFALDNGRFQNIEVSYPAGIFAETEADFRAAISDFRNFLCSRNGYVRLQDEYNPDEYRMAVYKSGLEVTPAMLKAGEFTITFDCKPQRWLTSGETAVEVDSGDTLTNPTRFESGPLLEVEGYGTIGFNGYEIELENAEMGDVELLLNYTSPTSGSANTNAVFYAYFNDNASTMRAGDTFIIDSLHITYASSRKSTTTAQFRSINPSSVQHFTNVVAKVENHNQDWSVTADFNNLSFTYGTASNSDTASMVLTIVYTSANAFQRTVTMQVEYDGADKLTLRASAQGVSGDWVISKAIQIPQVVGDSSMSILGHPTYVDCDLGECYVVDSGTVISLNQHIDLGSQLPTLATGENEVTYDDTITQLDIQPRWWKV